MKAKPQKKIPETDAIFEQVNQINQEADEDETTLRRVGREHHCSVPPSEPYLQGFQAYGSSSITLFRGGFCGDRRYARRLSY